MIIEKKKTLKLPHATQRTKRMAPPAIQGDVIQVSALMNGRTKVKLVHEGAEYILRITRNGKLILSK